MRGLKQAALSLLLAAAPTIARAQDRQTPLTPTPEGQGKLAIETDSFSLRLRGYVQADWRHVIAGSAWTDAFLVRRARAVFEASAFHRIEVKIMADFAASPMLYDAYIDGKITSWLRVRFGKDKIPVSIERLRSARNLPFVERAQPGIFTPTREIGAQVIAEPWQGRLSASAGIMQAVPDGVNPDILDGGDDKDFIARVFARPFSGPVLAGLGFGVSGTFGSATGSTTTPRLASYKTTAQSTYFSYRTTSSGDGPIAFDQRAHLGAHLYWTVGPAEIMAEVIESEQGVKLAGGSKAVGAHLHHLAYSTTLSVLVTGERASWDGVTPRHSFDPTRNEWGALELSMRTQGARFDDRSFALFADPTTSVRSAMSFGGSVTWIWNAVFQLQGMWESTTFGGGAKPSGDSTAPRDRPTEHTLMMRAQAAF